MTDSALQACALPFRRVRGRVEFCLITTSQGRWNYPKGVVDPGETHEQAALKEAFEEAGLHGRILGQPLGSYSLAKFGRTWEVTALLMQVHQCDPSWQEQHMRQRRWVGAQEARRLLTQRHLHNLLDEALRRVESVAGDSPDV